MAIAQVHAHAFGADGSSDLPAEVLLVERLRRSSAWLPRLSLVAVNAGVVVGHVVCSRARLEPSGAEVLGLAPIGVRPVEQRKGVGAALMHAVLGAADAVDEALVGLVGDPVFYRRFGFVPAAQVDIEPPEPDWGPHFQIRRLSEWDPAMRGRFRYALPFDEL